MSVTTQMNSAPKLCRLIGQDKWIMGASILRQQIQEAKKAGQTPPTELCVSELYDPPDYLRWKFVVRLQDGLGKNETYFRLRLSNTWVLEGTSGPTAKQCVNRRKLEHRRLVLRTQKLLNENPIAYKRIALFASRIRYNIDALAAKEVHEKKQIQNQVRIKKQKQAQARRDEKATTIATAIANKRHKKGQAQREKRQRKALVKRT